MIRILIVDDHAMVRVGLEQLLGSFADLEVIGSAANGREAVELVEQLRPDVVLMDLAMPEMDGIAATTAITQADPAVRVVILTTFDDPRRASAALSAGAHGYLLKDVEPEVLAAGIRSTQRGGAPLSPSISAALLRDGGRSATALPAVSERDVRLLRLIADGMTNAAIGRELGISEKTVKAHCTRLFLRIGVSDRTQAAVWATRHLPPTTDGG